MTSPTESEFEQDVCFIPRTADARLYSALIVPKHADPRRIVLFCPPTFEEHIWSYPIMRECARQLVRHDIASLRFDYYGAGDSTGTFDEFSMRSAVADITFLLQWLVDRFPRAQVVPIGVRLGARFMLEAVKKLRSQSDSARLSQPVLWDPVLDAKGYIYTELRKTLAGAMMIYQAAVASREDIIHETLEGGHCERDGLRLNQIDGYPVTRELLQNVTLDDAGAWRFEGAASAIVLDRTGRRERHANSLGRRLPRLDLHVVRDAPYWIQQQVYRQTREPLFRATQQCIERCV